MFKKKIMSVALSLALTVGMLSGYGVDAKAATKSVANQAAALADVSDAKADGNINVSLQGKEIAEGAFYALRNFYFNATNKDFYDEDDKLTEDAKNFVKFTDKLGITKGVNKDDEVIKSDNLDASVKVTSNIVTPEKFTMEISGKLAKGPEGKITTIEYNNGKVKIDLKSLASAISAYTDLTTAQVYAALGIPGLNEISLDVCDTLNLVLDKEVNPKLVKSFTVYTEEDGDEFADQIGQIKEVEYGEETDPKFNITYDQLMATVKTISTFAIGLIDPVLSNFEKQEGTKSTITITNAELPELLKKVGKTLQANAETAVNSIETTIFALPGFDEIYKGYPAGYLDAENLGTVSQIKKIGQTIESFGTEVTDKDEKGNEVKYVPITKTLEEGKMTVNASLSADTKGEKGYRDAKFEGKLDIHDAPDQVDKEGNPIVQTKVNISYNFNIKENGQAPTTKPDNSNVKKPTTNAKLRNTTVKSATKKKSANKVKIAFKKVNGAKKYQVQISTTKKFKKILVNKIIKKPSVTIKSKKLKNKKKLFARVKAVGASKWSKVKKIKIK